MATKRVVTQPKGESLKDQDALRAHVLEVKLKETLEALRSVSSQHNVLLKDFRTLSDKYVITKQCAMDTAWRYCPEHSKEFKAMPLQDKCLHEGSKSIGDYSVLEVLGQGQFSVVKKCKKNSARTGSSSSTGIVAIKQIAKDKIRGIEEVLRVERELQALKLLSPHPNIIHFVEALHGLECVYVVTELLPMDLFDFIDANHSRFDDNIVGVVISELMKAVGHLASHNIVHMDIKPENILLGLHRSPERLQVKLCDFGLCSILPDESSTLSEFCGSPGFFAPEVYIQKRFDGYKADIFSVGCVALEMLVPQDYFNEQWIRVYDALKGGDSLMLGRNVKDAIDALLKEIKKRHSRTVADCMAKLLSITPSMRPHAHEVLGLPTRRYSAESPAPDPTKIESISAGTAFSGGAGGYAGLGLNRHASPAAASRVSNSNGATSPFLWLSKCSMPVAVEKLWTFSVRRNSPKVMGDCASTGGASIIPPTAAPQKLVPSPCTAPAPAHTPVATSAPSPSTRITGVSPAITAPKPIASGSSKAPMTTAGSTTSAFAHALTPTPVAAVTVTTSASRKHSKALINYNCGGGRGGATGSSTSEATNGALNSTSPRIGAESAFGSKVALNASEKEAPVVRADTAESEPEVKRPSADSSIANSSGSTSAAAAPVAGISSHISRQQSLSTSSNAGLEDQTMRLHSTSSAAAHIPTALNAAIMSSGQTCEAAVPPILNATTAAPSAPSAATAATPLSVRRVGLPPPSLDTARSSRDSSESGSVGENGFSEGCEGNGGLEGFDAHRDSSSGEGIGHVPKRVTDAPSGSMGDPQAGRKAASAIHRSNQQHDISNPGVTAGRNSDVSLSNSPDFPQNDIPSSLLAHTPQSALPSLLHKPHAMHQNNSKSNSSGSKTASDKSKTPPSGSTSEHHAQYQQQHLHQQQNQLQEHSLPSIGTPLSVSTASSTTESSGSTPSVILASPGAASSSATTAAATMGGVFVQNPSHFTGRFSAHSPMIPISARSTPAVTPSPSTPTSMCTPSNTLVAQGQGVEGQHNPGVASVSVLMVGAVASDVDRVSATQYPAASRAPISVAEAASSSPVPPRHICPSPVRASGSESTSNDSIGIAGLSALSPSQPPSSASPNTAGYSRPTSGLSFSSAFHRTSSGRTGKSVRGNNDDFFSDRASQAVLPSALSVSLPASDRDGCAANQYPPLQRNDSKDSDEAGSGRCSTDSEDRASSESYSPPTISPGPKAPERENRSKDIDATGRTDPTSGGDTGSFHSDHTYSREGENENGRFEHKHKQTAFFA